MTFDTEKGNIQYHNGCINMPGFLFFYVDFFF